MSVFKKRLNEARRRFRAASTSLRRRWLPEREREYWGAYADLLQAERDSAAGEGRPHAVPLDFPLKWDATSPLPHLVCNDALAILAFVLRDDVTSDEAGGIRPDVAEAEETLLWAFVDFRGCVSAKLGSPNDEVFHGHRLEGSGLEPYTAQRVVNSYWLDEVEAINKAHHRYDPSRWKDVNHYVFWFHDSTFECLARSFAVETHRETLAEALARMCRQTFR